MAIVITWTLVTDGSTELPDDSSTLPRSTVQAELTSRGPIAEGTLTIEFPTTPILAQTQGTLTRINPAFTSYPGPAGSLWGEIDSRPRVVAINNEQFAFHRALSGGSRGPDVAELQRFLASHGFYSGEIDERFGPELRASLRSYRESIGADTGDGDLLPGDLLFVPGDSTVSLMELTVGMSVTSDTPVIEAVSLDPRIELLFLSRDAGTVTAGAAISGDQAKGTVTNINPMPVEIDGIVFLRADVDVTLEREFFDGERTAVTVTPPAPKRLWLPAGTVAINGSGNTYVVREDSTEQQVTITDETGGFVAIDPENIRPGESFFLPNPGLIDEP